MVFNLTPLSKGCVFHVEMHFHAIRRLFLPETKKTLQAEPWVCPVWSSVGEPFEKKTPIFPVCIILNNINIAHLQAAGAMQKFSRVSGLELREKMV